MQQELVARIEELLREQLLELGEDIASLAPHEYAAHMHCRVFPDQTMIYTWKGVDILKVVPEALAGGGTCWRMYTGAVCSELMQ